MDFAKPRTLWLLSAASPRSVSVDPDWGGEGVIGCVAPRGVFDAVIRCSVRLRHFIWFFTPNLRMIIKFGRHGYLKLAFSFYIDFANS